jgi:hypothetical protein
MLTEALTTLGVGILSTCNGADDVRGAGTGERPGPDREGDPNFRIAEKRLLSPAGAFLPPFIIVSPFVSSLLNQANTILPKEPTIELS